MIGRMSRFALVSIAASAGIVALAGCQADAANEDAWEAFRADVAEKCLAASEPLFSSAEIAIDPFGSEHYGMALLRGPARGAEHITIEAICVYDKGSRTAELGGELPPFGEAED